MSKGHNVRRKGFTLVELLVTISILGLITALSIPVIRNIIEANTMKKYSTYKDSVESSAKLYVDSYSDDLFGKKLSGCAYITYDQMNEKKLIKDIQENGISCNSDKTYVKVVKLGGKYAYSTQIGCGTTSNKKVKLESGKVNVIYPTGGINQDPSCGYDAVKLDVDVSPKYYKNTDKKKYPVRIVLSSNTGINNGVKVKYAWLKEGQAYSDDILQYATFKGQSIEKQKQDILNNKKITIKSNEILTPSGETGSYRLALKMESATDVVGGNLTEKLTSPIIFEPYKIDNLPPVISSIKVTSEEEFASLSAKVSLSATDNDKMSSFEELKVCIRTDDKTCTDSEYKAYKTSYSLTIPGNKYDGSTKKVYVSVKDNSGNVTKDSADYTIYKECTSVVKDKSNIIKEGTCSAKCGSNGTKNDTVGTKDMYTGAVCSETMKNSAECNRFDCCKEVRYEDGDTCSSSANTFCGTSTKNQLAYSKYDSSVRCSAYDKSSGGSSCSLGTCKPSKPTITNPTNGNWTNQNFSLKVKTTTPAANLGYWYYSYDAKNWIVYNAQNYDSYGKNVYETSLFSAERNQAVYIRVCNKKATRPTDSTNCSDYASTNIKIDKTPPTLTRTSNFNNCNNPQHPVNKKTYGQTVGNFAWHDNSNGSGMAAVEMDYSFYRQKKYCSHFRTAVSGTSSNNGIWIKYGGAVRWRIIVYDVAGNSTKLTGTGNCSNNVLYTVYDGASYINENYCNF